MNALTPMNLIPAGEQFALGLDLPETMTFDEWTNLGRKLCMARRAVNWVIGDWLIFGCDEARFGRAALEEANAIFVADADRFAPIVDTCRRFPEDRRRAALTFGHHLAVMAVEDDTEAETLLAKAEAERMTVAALRAEAKVRTDRQATMLPNDPDPEDDAYRTIIQASNRCGSPEARRLAIEAIIEANYGVVDL